MGLRYWTLVGLISKGAWVAGRCVWLGIVEHHWVYCEATARVWKQRGWIFTDWMLLNIIEYIVKQQWGCERGQQRGWIFSCLTSTWGGAREARGGLCAGACCYNEKYCCTIATKVASLAAWISKYRFQVLEREGIKADGIAILWNHIALIFFLLWTLQFEIIIKLDKQNQSTSWKCKLEASDIHL